MKEKILSELLMDDVGDRESPMDFRVGFLVLLKYWWLIALSLFMTVSLAVIYIFFATPEYSASTSILLKSDQEVGFVQNLVLSDLEGFNSAKKVENEIEVINSYSLMRDAIENLPVDASFYIEDRYFRKREIYGSEVPLEFHFVEPNFAIAKLPDDRTIRVSLKDDGVIVHFDETRSQHYSFGDTVSNWYGTFYFTKRRDFDEHTPHELILSLENKDGLAAKFRNRLQVTLSNKYASVLNLSINDPVRQRGVDILNNLVTVYNQQAVKEKNVTADNTIAFIDKQLETLSQELIDVEREIEEYKRTRSVSNLASEYESVLHNSTIYEGQLSRNRIQIEVLESIEEYINRPISNATEVPSSLSIEDATLNDLISRFNQSKREIDRVSRTVQENSPILKSLIDDLQSLKISIQSNLSNIKRGLEIENRNLTDRVRQIDSRIARVPEIERGLLELTRLQERKQEQVLYLQEKKEEAELSLASNTVANARVIDQASAGGNPVKPNKKMILGLAFMMGLGFPLAFVYYKFALSGKIVKRGDLEKFVPFAALGEIAKSPSKDFCVVDKGSRTPLSEQFRLIRSNLVFLLGDSDKHSVILTTSSVSGEGKTFFSYNFGATLSLTGKKVVLLEFDLRKPALFKNLGRKVNVGISDYILNTNLAHTDILQDSAVSENFKLIGCGALPSEPAELVAHYRAINLVEELKKDFDYVLIDSAPIGTVSDALALAPITDLCLFVVRFNYTQKNSLEFMQKLNLGNRFRDVRLILNDVKATNGYYGYTYGYGYEDKKPSWRVSV